MRRRKISDASDDNRRLRFKMYVAAIDFLLTKLLGKNKVTYDLVTYLERHLKISSERTGNDFRELHEWIDDPIYFPFGKGGC